MSPPFNGTNQADTCGIHNWSLWFSSWMKTMHIKKNLSEKKWDNFLCISKMEILSIEIENGILE